MQRCRRSLLGLRAASRVLHVTLIPSLHAALQLADPLPDPVNAQVTKLNPRLASLDILCVGNRPLDATFAGIIRCEKRRRRISSWL